MAKPRIFVSSTYYDLRTVRDDLDRFIREMGYEPVRHERGHISYGKDEAPEEYAYREIDFCEILVCVIGGKFGSTSSDGTSSITQRELRSAVERGKQVYVFVEEAVFHEHRHFLANKGISGVRYVAVDDSKIHEFLEEMYGLPKGNPVFSFAVSSDITRILREQWSGLFQRLLTESSVKSQTVLIEELQRNLLTVGQLVKFLTEEKSKGDKGIQQILFANHPFFAALQKATRNAYRLYFINLKEMEQWLASARAFTRVDEEFQDEPNVYEWIRSYKSQNVDETQFLYINKAVFTENGDIKPTSDLIWDENFVQLKRVPKPKKLKASGFDNLSDDIPF